MMLSIINFSLLFNLFQQVAWQVIERILGDLLNTSIQTIQLNPIRQLLEEVPGEKQVEFVKGEDDGSEKSTYVVKVSSFA